MKKSRKLKRTLISILLVVSLVLSTNVYAIDSSATDNAKFDEIIMAYLTAIYNVNTDSSIETFGNLCQEDKSELIMFSTEKSKLKKAIYAYYNEDYVDVDISYEQINQSYKDDSAIIDLKVCQRITTKEDYREEYIDYSFYINSDLKIYEVLSNDNVDMSYRSVENFLAENIINAIKKDDQYASTLYAQNALVEKSMLAEDAAAITSGAVAYDRNAAVTYATGWCTSRQPVFPDYTGFGGDCQNFASQSLYVGYGGYLTYAAIDNKNFPMITGSGSRDWYTRGTRYTATDNWVNVGTFRSYVTGSGVGVHGWVYQGDVSYAEPGDIVQVAWTGGGSHSYIVVEVKGTAGYRTKEDVKVVAHTTDISPTWLNVANSEPLSNHYLIRIASLQY